MIGNSKALTAWFVAPASDSAAPTLGSLAELFTYLAQDPEALLQFKDDPEKFLEQPFIRLSDAERQLFRNATGHYEFTADFHDKPAIRIDSETREVEISRRGFRVDAQGKAEVIRVPEEPGLWGGTEDEGRLRLNFYDLSVVYAFTISDYQFREDGLYLPPQTVEVRDARFPDPAPFPGQLEGFIGPGGEFDIAVDLDPQRNRPGRETFS